MQNFIRSYAYRLKTKIRVWAGCTGRKKLYTRHDFPAIKQHSLLDAKLFATRQDMVRSICPRKGVIAEIGVALGDFSEFLITTLEPSKFFAMDLFDLEKYQTVWGQRPARLFDNLSHFEYYKRRFSNRHNLVRIEKGNSHELLAAHNDQYFDLIYIDAGHAYEEVKADSDQAIRKIKTDGMLI